MDFSSPCVTEIIIDLKNIGNGDIHFKEKLFLKNSILRQEIVFQYYMEVL